MVVDWRHPCLGCGACCQGHRVLFHWMEAEDATPGGVPLDHCQDHNQRLRVMRGTANGGRCQGLAGVVGVDAHCAIHVRRPSCCRDFPPSYEDGTPNERCDRSRARFGLPPLCPADWAGISSGAADSSPAPAGC